MKRFMPFMFRQIGLLCRRKNNQYLMLKDEKNILTIPKIVVEKEESFDKTIKRYLQSLNLDYKIRGIAKIIIGNDRTHNFYKMTYFVELNQQQQIRNGELLFYKYQKQNTKQIEFYIREILDQIATNKQIVSSTLFRQNYKQVEPRNPDVKALINI